VPRKRTILGFAVRALILYGLLVAPWPGVASGFRSVYCWCASAALGSLARNVSVYLEPAERKAAVYDCQLRVINRQTGGGYMLAVHSRTEAYVPLAVLLSLVLATPIPWRRRLRSLAMGLAALLAVMFCRHIVMVLFAASQPSAGLVHAAYPWDKVLTVAMKIAAADIVMSMGITFLVWLVVCFRLRDWESLAEPETKRVARAGPSEEGESGGAEVAAQKKRRRRRNRLERSADSS